MDRFSLGGRRFGLGRSAVRLRGSRMALVGSVALLCLAALVLAGPTVAERGSAPRERDGSLNDPHVREVLDRWARENRARDLSHPPYSELAYIEEGLREQRGRREARRGSAEARRERQRSRRAFKDLGRDRAVMLARQTFPELFSGADRRALPLERGDRVVRYLGGRSALVDTGAGPPSVVESTVPLRVRDESGDLVPVDLDLEHNAEGWEPESSTAEVALGERANRALSFPGRFRVGIPGSEAVGSREANEVFYPDVATDVDAWFGPSDTGGRFAFQLRSEDSPEELRVSIEDAPGVELRVAADGTGVEMLDGGKQVGAISPPLAFDADGVPIDVMTTVEPGQGVVFEVSHRGRDLRYPAVVDPYVYESQEWNNGSSNTAGWRYSETVPQFPHGWGYLGGVGTGFSITRNEGYPFSYGAYAEYFYPAPTAYAFIHRTDFMGVLHWSANNTATTQGMWSTTQGRHQHQYTRGYGFNDGSGYVSVCAGGAATSEACDEYLTNAEYDASLGNYVQSSLWITVGGAQYQDAWNYFTGARTWMSDNEPPTLLYFEGSPAGWVHDVPPRGYSYNPNEAHVRWGDRGLGMWRLWMDVPGKARQYSTDAGGCAGTQSSRCPETRAHTFSYAGMNEGIQTVTTTGEDILGKQSTASKTLRIDRTPPTVAFSGPLKAAEGTELSPGSHQLRVAARDGDLNGPAVARRSGVRSVEILLDGEPVDRLEQECAADSCPIDRAWTFNTNDHPGGEHLVEVIASDQIDHETTRSFRFTSGPCCLDASTSWGSAALREHVIYGDVNGDARADAVGRNNLTGEFEAALSTGSSFASFASWGRLLPLDAVTGPELADVNGDGLDDLVGRNPTSGDVLVARSNGSSFEPATTWANWPLARSLKLADADGDGSNDIAGRDNDGQVYVGYSTGAAFESGQSWTSYTVAGIDEVHFADVDADNAEDLVIRSGDSIRVGLAVDGIFRALETWGSVPGGRRMLFGDANGDFKADLLGIDPGGGQVILGTSTGSAFRTSINIGSFPAGHEVQAADTNGDSEDDLVGHLALTGDLRVALMRMAIAQGGPAEDWTPRSGLVYDAEDPLTAPLGEPDVPPDNPAVDPVATASAKRPTMRLAFQDDRRLLQRYRLPRTAGNDEVVIDESRAFGDQEADAVTAIQRIYARLKAAGGNNTDVKPIIRFNVYQGWHENRDGSYFWTKLDKAVDLARSNGFAVYLTISGLASESDCKKTYNPAGRGCLSGGGGVSVDQRTGVTPNVEEFGNFAREVVRHFQGRIKTYSIWNEPNNNVFLSAGSPDIVPIHLYRRLYVNAYDKIRGLHRNAPSTYDPVRVFIGELAYFARSGRVDCSNCKKGRIDALEFLERTARTNPSSQGRIVTHGVAWHPYQHVGTPTRAGPRPDHYGIGKAAAIQNRLDDLADRRVLTDERTGKALLTTPRGKRPPLFFTEFGYHNQPLLGKDPDKEKATGTGRPKHCARSTCRSRSTERETRGRSGCSSIRRRRSRRESLRPRTLLMAPTTACSRLGRKCSAPDGMAVSPEGEWRISVRSPFRLARRTARSTGGLNGTPTSRPVRRRAVNDPNTICLARRRAGRGLYYERSPRVRRCGRCAGEHARRHILSGRGAEAGR